MKENVTYCNDFLNNKGALRHQSKTINNNKLMPLLSFDSNEFRLHLAHLLPAFLACYKTNLIKKKREKKGEILIVSKYHLQLISTQPACAYI